MRSERSVSAKSTSETSKLCRALKSEFSRGFLSKRTHLVNLRACCSRIVIISTVRSKEMRWLPIDRAQNRGLIHEPKRFNVAMTRAKELLIVIGNANTLTVSS